MFYHSFIINCNEAEYETLASIFMDRGFEGSAYENGELTTYSKEALDLNELDELLSPLGLKVSKTVAIKDRNWNRWWESNFLESLIGNRIQVRAPFHQTKDREYEIIIQPAMAFGTGHHGTSSLMLESMLDSEFKNKSVLDMGCGSGILSIMAEKLGAKAVDAIDQDVYAVDNAQLNLQLNSCSNVEVRQDSNLDKVTKEYDIILSNIVKNINLSLLPSFLSKLRPGGELLLCGFLKTDRAEVIRQTEALNLNLLSERSDGEWLQLSLSRSL